MQPPPLEVTWLDSRETVSLAELSRVCGMSTDELNELVDYGALVPVAPVAALALSAPGSFFSAGCIVQLRTACKLRLDFDLDVFTAAILMGYLDRIDGLERQVRSLQAAAGDQRSQTQPHEGHAT